MPKEPHDDRYESLAAWLQGVVTEPHKSLAPASADASFRRYFRLETDQRSYVVMDAPPKQEPIQAFLDTAAALQSQGVHVPKVHAFDQTLGFIVLEDLGTLDYLTALPDQPDTLYESALQSLIKLQGGNPENSGFSPPSYDHRLLEQELDVFEEWYLGRHLQVDLSSEQKRLWQQTKEHLIQACLEQPQVWVHRDFHSRNLMVCAQNSPGVIDFQDMVLGPIAYDVVSLFKDCYIEWPRTEQLKWCEAFFNLLADPRFTMEQFVRWYDLTGLQRHLKVLGVFCRLHYRDGKSQYLNDLPLVRKYVAETLPLYSNLSEFERWFEALPHT